MGLSMGMIVRRQVSRVGRYGGWSGIYRMRLRCGTTLIVISDAPTSAVHVATVVILSLHFLIVIVTIIVIITVIVVVVIDVIIIVE